MKNVDMKVVGKKLTITVDLTQEHGQSSTGKSTIIATTSGNIEVPGAPGVKIGFSVYKKAED